MVKIFYDNFNLGKRASGSSIASTQCSAYYGLNDYVSPDLYIEACVVLMCFSSTHKEYTDTSSHQIHTGFFPHHYLPEDSIRCHRLKRQYYKTALLTTTTITTSNGQKILIRTEDTAISKKIPNILGTLCQELKAEINMYVFYDLTKP